MNKHKLYDWIFNNTLGRLDSFKHHSPDVNLIGNSVEVIRKLLAEDLERHPEGYVPSFIDIGARDGSQARFAAGYNYSAMDLKPRSGKVVLGDICNCPEIPANSFDVVFSLDVFEHLQRPWDAARHCIRIVKPGGLLIHQTLFAYRYHPHPIDYWRFTSQCLEYLFTESGQVQTITKGYDIRNRRRDHRGSNLRSRPPIDWLGGFRENWQVLYVGRKIGGEQSPE